MEALPLTLPGHGAGGAASPSSSVPLVAVVTSCGPAACSVRLWRLLLCLWSVCALSSTRVRPTGWLLLQRMLCCLSLARQILCRRHTLIRRQSVAGSRFRRMLCRRGHCGSLSGGCFAASVAASLSRLLRVDASPPRIQGPVGYLCVVVLWS